MVMVMEEFLPCLFKSLYVSLFFCSHIFKFFPMMLVSCYALVGNGNMCDAGMRWKNVYVSFIMLDVLEICDVKNERKQVKTICKSLPYE